MKDSQEFRAIVAEMMPFRSNGRGEVVSLGKMQLPYRGCGGVQAEQ